MDNLQKSFPEKTPDEIQRIAKNFYAHLADTIVESIRQFSMGESELRRRVKVKNPELLNDLQAQGRDVMGVGGHYNNWEIVVTAIPLFLKHRLLGIYAPLKNSFLNEKVQRSRGKYGLGLLPKKQVPTFVRQAGETPFLLIFAIDQNPSSKRVFWINFLGRETPVATGAEWCAKKFDAAVVFLDVQKIKRGHYEITFELLEDAPLQTKDGDISLRHTQRLERQIREKPEYWLWAHRRWKRQRTDA